MKRDIETDSQASKQREGGRQTFGQTEIERKNLEGGIKTDSRAKR